MQYVLTDDQNNLVKYPYNVGLLRKDNPNTSFPKVIPEARLNDFNVFKIVEVKPSHESWQVLQKPDTPVYQNGQWELVYTVADKTLEQLESENTRLLEERKRVIRQEAEAAYEQPVTLPDGSVWNGGMSSALSIDGAVRMAENAGLAQVSLYDTNNTEHVVDITTGKSIAAAIGAEYQRLFGIKQTCMQQLSTVDLTTTTAKDEIEAVVFAS
jgi:hypothetical protein